MIKYRTEEQKNQFKALCTLIDFKYEYPGYTGDVRYGFYSVLPKHCLQPLFGNVLDQITPYIELDKGYVDARNDYKKNEKKYEYRNAVGNQFSTDDDFDEHHIRLTNLVPELLEIVDDGRMKLRPAVELSYLNEDCQRDLVEEIDLNDCTPSHAQTIRMRKMFEEGKLTPEAIQAIMSEQKPNQQERIVLSGDRVRKFIPKSIPLNKTEEYVCKALEHYASFLRKRAERDSR